MNDRIFYLLSSLFRKFQGYWELDARKQEEDHTGTWITQPSTAQRQQAPGPSSGASFP